MKTNAFLFFHILKAKKNLKKGGADLTPEKSPKEQASPETFWVIKG